MPSSRNTLRLREVPLPGTEDPQATDEELLAATRDGDVAGFEGLYQRHGARMKSIACNLLGSVSDAEDAVQETFLKIYRGAGAFRGGAAFSTWIYRILLNTCYDAMRRRKRRREEPPPSDSSALRLELPVTLEDHPLRLELEDSVARLPEKPRSVFLLHAVEGFSHREIGEMLGVSEGGSRTLLFEAKRELQRLLWSRRAGESHA